jgi:hypothetical protein
VNRCAEATEHARPGRGGRGRGRFRFFRASRRPRTGRRARTGPVDVERPARTILQRYHEDMNGPVPARGGVRIRCAPRVPPRPAGGPILGRATEAEICERRGIRSLESEKYVEKICRENMPPAPGRSRTAPRWRPAGPPDPGRTAVHPARRSSVCTLRSRLRTARHAAHCGRVLVASGVVPGGTHHSPLADGEPDGDATPLPRGPCPNG